MDFFCDSSSGDHRSSIEEYYRLSSNIEDKEIYTIISWADALESKEEGLCHLKKYLVCCKVIGLIENGDLEGSLKECHKYHDILLDNIEDRIFWISFLDTLFLAGLIGGADVYKNSFSWTNAKLMFQNLYCSVNGLSIVTHLETR
jgi:hypothetical protein